MAEAGGGKDNRAHHALTPGSILLVQRFEKQLARWNVQINTLRTIQVLLALHVVTATAVLTFIGDGHERLRKAMGVVIAIAGTTLAGFGIGDKADRWRTAWRQLTYALALRQIGEIGDRDLLDASCIAEDLIGGLTINVRSTAPDMAGGDRGGNPPLPTADSLAKQLRAQAVSPAPSRVTEAVGDVDYHTVPSTTAAATADGSYQKPHGDA